METRLRKTRSGNGQTPWPASRGEYRSRVFLAPLCVVVLEEHELIARSGAVASAGVPLTLAQLLVVVFLAYALSDYTGNWYRLAHARFSMRILGTPIQRNSTEVAK